MAARPGSTTPVKLQSAVGEPVPPGGPPREPAHAPALLHPLGASSMRGRQGGLRRRRLACVKGGVAACSNAAGRRTDRHALNQPRDCDVGRVRHERDVMWGAQHEARRIPGGHDRREGAGRRIDLPECIEAAGRGVLIVDLEPGDVKGEDPVVVGVDQIERPGAGARLDQVVEPLTFAFGGQGSTTPRAEFRSLSAMGSARNSRSDRYPSGSSIARRRWRMTAVAGCGRTRRQHPDAGPTCGRA